MPPAGNPAPRRGTLAGRATLVTIAVAFVAVFITGLVSLRLVTGATEDEAARTLARYAQILASAPHNAGGGELSRAPAVRSLFGRLQVSVLVVRSDGAVAGRRALVLALPADVVPRAMLGTSFTEIVGRQVIAAAPLAGGAGDLVLVQRRAVAASLTGPLRLRLLVALLAGLAVAALAGMLLAHRLARPLQLAASAARRLAAGDRTVRLDPEGPAEVAEVSDALNALTAALSTSEGRQRDFLLSVSHELRTPLTAIKGYAEALADGVVPDPDVAATGATVLAEADRLERLVTDLLDLGRLGAQDFRLEVAEVDVVALLDAAAQVWRDRCARTGVVFRLERPEHSLWVRTDVTRVRQIVDGLAENALRVTPAGAPLVLACRVEPGAAVVEVRDGGPGLTDDDLRVAFERSALYDRYRGTRRVGTGVGLALVAGLAARLGGVAEVGHAVEGGARFGIRLPRDEDRGGDRLPGVGGPDV